MTSHRPSRLPRRSSTTANLPRPTGYLGVNPTRPVQMKDERAGSLRRLRSMVNPSQLSNSAPARPSRKGGSSGPNKAENVSHGAVGSTKTGVAAKQRALSRSVPGTTHRAPKDDGKQSVSTAPTRSVKDVSNVRSTRVLKKHGSKGGPTAIETATNSSLPIVRVSQYETPCKRTRPEPALQAPKRSMKAQANKENQSLRQATGPHRHEMPRRTGPTVIASKARVPIARATRVRATRPQSRLGHYADRNNPLENHTDLASLKTPLKPRDAPIRAVVPRRAKIQRIQLPRLQGHLHIQTSLHALPTQIIAHSPHPSRCDFFTTPGSDTATETPDLKRSVWTLKDEMKLIKNNGVVSEADVQIVAPEARMVPLCLRSYNGVVAGDSPAVSVRSYSNDGSPPNAGPLVSTPPCKSRTRINRRTPSENKADISMKEIGSRRLSSLARKVIGQTGSDPVEGPSSIVAVTDGGTEEVPTVVGISSPPMYPRLGGKSSLTRAFSLMKFVRTRSGIGKVAAAAKALRP